MANTSSGNSANCGEILFKSLKKKKNKILNNNGSAGKNCLVHSTSREHVQSGLM